MKKIIRNVLILLLGILVFGTIICNNQVRAEDVNAQDILSLIPDTIELGIPEEEYEQLDSILFKKIKEILINNNIQCEIIDNSGNNNFSSYIRLIDKTYNGQEFRIWLSTYTTFWGDNVYSGVSISTSDSGKYLYPKLIYNKKEGYSLEDEKYVKNLKLQNPEYYEVDISELSKFDYENGLTKIVEKYYTNLINDSSIIIKAIPREGGGNYLGTGGRFEIGIIKNGILYDIIEDNALFMPSINVPKDVCDEQLVDYINQQIQKYYKDTPDIIRISKGIEMDMEIINGYTVYFEDIGDEYNYDYIIINREIERKDEENNIILETDSKVVPEDTIIEAEKITSGDTYNTVMATLGDTVDKFILYDISLVSNNTKVQPNGKVKISIPIPEGFNKEKLVVYRISGNEKTKYDVTIETIDGKDYAIFETDHFSIYTLAMEKEVAQSENITKTEETVTKDNKLDETPKTGYNSIIITTITIVALISLAGIIIIKKK